MWGRSILSMLYLIVATAFAVPANYDSSTSDENGLVYVFNIYAVRNTKTQSVAKKLVDEAMFKVPANFEPIGSILLADTDADEPFTMSEFSEFLEEMGVSVEKLNDQEDPKVIEIKIDMSFEDFDDFVSFEEIVRALQVEGINLEVTEEDGVRILKVAFDETKKNVEDQPFTLEELGEFFEKEGFDVDFVRVHGAVKAVNIRFEDAEDDTKQSVEPKQLEQKPERDENKIEKYDDVKKKKIEQDFSQLDFTTKSESLNKIRRRRQAAKCPECQVANITREFVNKRK